MHAAAAVMLNPHLQYSFWQLIPCLRISIGHVSILHAGYAVLMEPD